MKLRELTSIVLITLALISCSKSNEEKTVLPNSTSGKNYLTMKINGVEWKADNKIFGAFHPKGYDDAIIISGSKGPENKDEQIFNLNLYKNPGTGTYDITEGAPNFNAAQFLNYSELNFQAGANTGFSMKVNITKASETPSEVEATFEGTLNGIDGSVLTITEGKFYYHE